MQVANSKRLQTFHGADFVAIALAIAHLGSEAGSRDGGDVRNANQRSGEVAMVAWLGTFDGFAAKNDLHGPGDAAQWEFVLAFLDPHLLIVDVGGVVHVQRETRAVCALRVVAFGRLKA